MRIPQTEEVIKGLMYQLFQQISTKLTSLEHCPHRLALSATVGVFLACAPLLGIQTVLAFIVSYLGQLNGSIVLIILFLVNNPFTMVPIIMANYGVGYIVFEKYMAINTTEFLPLWMGYVNTNLEKTVHKLVPQGNFSVGNYIFGGFLFGILCSIPVYPVMYLLGKRWAAEKKPSPPIDKIR